MSQGLGVVYPALLVTPVKITARRYPALLVISQP